MRSAARSWRPPPGPSSSAGGDGSGNTAAPLDDFGFASLGITIPAGHTAVHLGAGWVVTARHVAEADLIFDGVTYPAVPGSSVLLTNPDASLADLRVYRLAIAPPLPSLRLSSAPVALGDVVTCAGHGWIRMPDLHYWDADWNEVEESDPDRIYTGFEQNGSAGQAMRWGRNQVDVSEFFYHAANGVTMSFLSAFDQNGIPEEAHTVRGDSGAGCFAKRGNRWEIVGVLHGRATNPGQTTNRVVFDTVSYGADLYHYRDQIDALVGPPVHVPGPSRAWRLGLVALLTASVWGHLGQRDSRPKKEASPWA